MRDALFVCRPEEDWAVAELGRTLLRVPRPVLRAWVARNGTWAIGTRRILPYLWRSGEPNALQGVAQGLERQPRGELRFFFSTGGWPYPVSTAMLTMIEPYLPWFEPRDLQKLGEGALRAGHREWVATHCLDALHEGAREEFFPTSKRILGALADCESSKKERGHALLSRSGFLLEEKWPWNEVRTQLDRWCSDGDVDKTLIATQLVTARGKLEDVEWLNRLPTIRRLPHDVVEEAAYACARRQVRD